MELPRRRRDLTAAQHQSREAYARALAMPALVLAAWAGAFSLYLGMEEWDRQARLALVFGVGCCVPAWAALLGLRRVSWQQRHEAVGREATIPAVLASTLAVPDCQAEVWKVLADQRGANFAGWAIAQLDAEATPVEALKFADRWYRRWNTARGPAATDQSRAAHEAAHAVVAHVLGCTVTSVSIVPSTGDESAGRTVVHLPVPRVSPASQHLILMSVLLAGRDEDTTNGLHDTGSRDDMAKLVQCAAAIISTRRQPAGHHGPLTTDALIATAARRTIRILVDQRLAVRHLAAVLVARRAIGGVDLRNLLPAREGVPDQPFEHETIAYSELTDEERLRLMKRSSGLYYLHPLSSRSGRWWPVVTDVPADVTSAFAGAEVWAYPRETERHDLSVRADAGRQPVAHAGGDE